MPIDSGVTADGFDIEAILAQIVVWVVAGAAPMMGGHRSEYAAAASQEVDTVALGVGPICQDYDPELASALGIDLA